MGEIVSPRAAALRILAARYQLPAAGDASAYQLADFQRDAVEHALQILNRRGGVLIADSVGLGKTYVAAALIERHPDPNVVVVVPAGTRPMWRRTLRRLPHESLHLLTHGQLSRGVVAEDAGIVVVDEAHAFRNPTTRRYRALRRICHSARVVLLSATPVNNSLSDLMFQLRLWCADDAFRDLGIGSLAALLHTPEPDRQALDRLRRAVVIRRTRSAVRRRFPAIQMPDGRTLRFPRERRLETVRHRMPLHLDLIESRLLALEFAAHDQRAVTPLLLRLNLLKRLQSSNHAALVSTERLIDFNKAFLSALADGRLLSSRFDGGEQLMFMQLITEELPPSVDAAVLRQRIGADLRRLRELRALLQRTNDEKLQLLTALLEQRALRRTLVFSEFRDTAEYLWRRLRDRFPVALITGGSAYLGTERCARPEIIRRFAPVANGAAPPPRHECVEVLVATDVLAEGMNLQDADAVVSYDLPWNPVRLIQRAGRIDRMGSKHDTIHIYNFLPDLEFDQFLHLLRRLRGKLIDAAAIIGQEAPVLEPLELDPGFLNRLDHADASLLDEPAEADPLRQEWENSCGEAGSAGAVGVLGSHATWLIAMTNGVTARELIVRHGIVEEDPARAAGILERALSDRESRAGDPALAIADAREYLRVSDGCAGCARDAAVVARAIRRAVQRLGLLCPPRITERADRVLELLPGYLGNSRGDAASLRTASIEELLAALDRIERSCTPNPQPHSDRWNLLAAIASD